MGIKEMAAANRESFPREAVRVDEWGDTIYLRAMSSNERFQYELIFAKGIENVSENYRVKLVGLCAVDADGKRIFTSKEDFDLLGGQPASLLDRLFDVASKINAVTQDSVEALEKNFEPIDSDASTSA